MRHSISFSLNSMITESKKKELAQIIFDGMDLEDALDIVFDHVLSHLNTLDPEELSIEAANYDLV